MNSANPVGNGLNTLVSCAKPATNVTGSMVRPCQTNKNEINLIYPVRYALSKGLDQIPAKNSDTGMSLMQHEKNDEREGLKRAAAIEAIFALGVISAVAGYLAL